MLINVRMTLENIIDNTGLTITKSLPGPSNAETIRDFSVTNMRRRIMIIGRGFLLPIENG